MRDDSLVIPKYIVPPQPALVKTPKKNESILRNLWHPGYDETKYLQPPLNLSYSSV